MLRERLAIYSEYVRRPEFVDEALRPRLAALVDDRGLVKDTYEHWRRW